MSDNIKAEASMIECNHGGIEVGNVTSDSLYWRRNWGEDNITEWKEAEIHYSNKDNDGDYFYEDNEIYSNPYFTTDNKDEEGNEFMYFLNEFTRYDR